MAMWMEWALTSSFLILVMLLLRKVLGKHISARLCYALWAVVLLRLLVPVQLFSSPVPGVSVSRWTERYLVEEQNTGPLSQAGDIPPGSPNTAAPPLPGQSNVTVPENNSTPDTALEPAPIPTAAALNWDTAAAALGWIWLGGGVLVGLGLLASNLRFAASLRRRRTPLNSAGCPLPVYIAEGLPSPCLFGLFRPAIYVTPESAKDHVVLRHVLAHEQAHARHRDHLWSALRCLALAAHWWNPLVWLAVVLSRRDGELACDEGALNRLGDGERTAYGRTLLALVTSKPSPADLFHCATTMTGGKRALRERIRRIARAPKRLLWAVVLAVVIAVFAAACAFARAETPGEPLDPDQTNPEWGVTLTVRDVSPTGLSYELDDTAVTWRYTTGTWYTVHRWDEEIADWVAVEELPLPGGINRAWTLVGYSIPRDGTVDWSDLYGTLAPGLYRFGKEVSRGTGADYEDITLYARFRIDLPEPDTVTTLPDAADLNHNGIPETLEIRDYEGLMCSSLTVLENGKSIFYEHANSTHVDWNSVFLYRENGLDYLLRYYCVMFDGYANYNYQLFYLDKSGAEIVVQEKQLEFDINFGSSTHQSFSPEDIADFWEEVNALLSDCVQLVNTNEDLLESFAREGQLYHVPRFLYYNDEIFTFDAGKSMVENLRDYKYAMELYRSNRIY